MRRSGLDSAYSIPAKISAVAYRGTGSEGDSHCEEVTVSQNSERQGQVIEVNAGGLEELTSAARLWKPQ